MILTLVVWYEVQVNLKLGLLYYIPQAIALQLGPPLVACVCCVVCSSYLNRWVIEQ